MLKDLDIDQTTFMQLYAWYSDFHREKCALNSTLVFSHDVWHDIHYLAGLGAKM